MGRGEAAKARTGDGLPSSRKAGRPGEEATNTAKLSPAELKEGLRFPWLRPWCKGARLVGMMRWVAVAMLIQVVCLYFAFKSLEAAYKNTYLAIQD